MDFGKKKHPLNNRALIQQTVVKISCGVGLLMFLMLPTVGQAQFTYTSSGGKVTITDYTGPGGVVIIPPTLDGLPVTMIGGGAFFQKTSVTHVTIPNSVTVLASDSFAYCTGLTNVIIGTNVSQIQIAVFAGCSNLLNIIIPNKVTRIGSTAFSSCVNLTNLTIGTNVSYIESSAFSSCLKLPSIAIPSSVTNIESAAFAQCTNLTAITVDPLNSFYCGVDGVLFNKNQTVLMQYPGGKSGSYSIANSVTNIDARAFSYCTRLTSVTIPQNIVSIGTFAFNNCTNLSAVYFKGNAFSVNSSIFSGATNVIVYYLPGTIGWGSTFANRPAVLWNPQAQVNDASFGVRTNKFGFTVTGSSNLVIVVEACTNLIDSVWFPVETNTFTDGAFYFSDPHWANNVSRFYRLRAP